MTSSEDYIVRWTSGDSSSATADYVTVFWCWGIMNRSNVHCKVNEYCTLGFLVVVVVGGGDDGRYFLVFLGAGKDGFLVTGS